MQLEEKVTKVDTFWWSVTRGGQAQGVLKSFPKCVLLAAAWLCGLPVSDSCRAHLWRSGESHYFPNETHCGHCILSVTLLCSWCGVQSSSSDPSRTSFSVYVDVLNLVHFLNCLMAVGEMVWRSDCGLGYRIPRRVLPSNILNPDESAQRLCIWAMAVV